MPKPRDGSAGSRAASPHNGENARQAGRQIIVTRPAQEAALWVEKLQAAGFDAVALPLIEIASSSNADDAKQLQNAWKNIHQYAACMFVSSNAVAYFFRANGDVAQSNSAQAAPYLIASQRHTAVPPGCRFLAPGPGTAAALQSAGVNPLQIDSPPADAAQFDSTALWDVVRARNWQGARVLVVRGNSPSGASLKARAADNQLPDSADQPRNWLVQQLQAAGSQVDVLTVYERRAPVLTALQIELARSAASSGAVWLFSSAEAVSNLRAMAPLIETVGTGWGSAMAIATHPRILQAVQAAGFGRALASRPTLPEVVQALRSIESTAP